MIRPSRQLLIAWFFFWDEVCTAIAWLAAYLVRFQSGLIPLRHAPRSWDDHLVGLPLVLILAGVAYRLGRMYEVHRLRRFRDEFFSVLRGTFLLVLLVLTAVFFRQEHAESRATILIFYSLVTGLVLTARRATWQTLRALRRRGYNQVPAIIVGTGRVARKTARALRHASWTGMRCIGFVDSKPNRHVADLHILGTLDDLPRLVREHRVAHVFIALPLQRFDEIRRVFACLAETLVEIRLVLDIPALAALSLSLSSLDGLPVVSLRESPHYGINRCIKRLMDIALASVSLFVLAPVMVTIALLIRLTSRGPVLYRQERCSLGGKPFQMLKFRTMHVNAEEHTGPVWAKPNDPRRTPLGAFLRKTSLDELPQLFNVLRGEMSLVGPRPERPVFVDRFKKTIPNYMIRHSVKAGITGWAQVHGWRGNTSLRKRVEYDLYYITHWTPWLDLKILAMTLVKGLISRHAY